MAKSPEEMILSMISNMPEKTGRTLAEWLLILNQTSLKKHGEMVKFLKSEHGVTHGFANMIAHKALEQENPSPKEDDLVSAQYAGPKAELRPIYDALITRITAFGADVEISPKKAYVSLRRNKQFALIQPSTKTRVDVGINLKATPPTDRLEASGSFNAMVSHRVRLARVSDIDDQLIQWIRDAWLES